MEGGLLLDVVIGESPPVFQLLAGEDQPLLIRRDALLVLDLGLDVLYGIRGLDLERDRLSSQRLDEDLHSTTETQDQVESGFLLDVIIRKGATIFQLLSSEDQPLLVRGDSLLVLTEVKTNNLVLSSKTVFVKM